MIGRLRGPATPGAKPFAAIVWAGDVGYEVRASEKDLKRMLGENFADLFIETVVREDSITLFGFFGHSDLSLFRFLVGIRGIGPKSALLVLGAPNVEELLEAGDVAGLSRVKGLGPKTAAAVVGAYRKAVKK